LDITSTSSDSPLAGVNTPRSDEDRLEIMELTVVMLPKFWNTVVVKQTNDVTRLQALVNKKKVVITEATIRDALPLDDAEGVDCLPNEEIFVELARMGDLSTHTTKYTSPALTQKVFVNMQRVEVVTAASETITAASANITAAKAQVHAVTLTVAPTRVAASLSRRRK
nr:hypothetical protein [Tanacetum cinerariifolium]